MKIGAGKTLLCIGDSITDAERDPTGELTPWIPRNGLGRGYVDQFNALLTHAYPERRIRVINRGVGGNTVVDLAARWPNDVLAAPPAWLSVAIGINDVWRQFDTPLKAEIQVLPDRYASVYRGLLERTRPALEGLVLVTPFVVEPNAQDPFRKRMDEYGAIVKQLAWDYGALLVDAQAAVDRLTCHYHPTCLAWDRIHLNSVGHMALAQALFAALDS